MKKAQKKSANKWYLRSVFQFVCFCLPSPMLLLYRNWYKILDSADTKRWRYGPLFYYYLGLELTIDRQHVAKNNNADWAWSTYQPRKYFLHSGVDRDNVQYCHLS